MRAGEVTGLAYAVVVNVRAFEATSAAHAVFLRPVMSGQCAASCIADFASTVLVRPVMRAFEATGLAYAVVINVRAFEATSAAHAVLIRPVVSVGYIAGSSTGLASTVLVRPVMRADEAAPLANAVIVGMIAALAADAAHTILIRPVMSVGYIASSSTGLASTVLVRPVVRAGEAAPLADAVIVGMIAALAADAAVALRAIPTVRAHVTAVFADTARVNMLAVGIAAGRAVAGAVLLCPLVSVNHIASCLTFRAGAAVVRPVMLALKAASFAHAVSVSVTAGETADTAHAVLIRPVMSVVENAAGCTADLAAALRAVPVMRADEVAVFANTIGVSMSADRGTLLAGANAVHIRPDVFIACILRFTYGALDESAAENRHVPFVNAFLLAIIADTVVPRMGFLLHSANLTLAVVAVVLPTVRAGSAACRAFAGRAVPLAGVCADIAAVLASAADVDVDTADCAAFFAGANTIHIRPCMFRTAGTQQFAYYALAVAV